MLLSYEPELHPAATYRIKQLKATIQVFSTGSITVTGTQRFPVQVERGRVAAAGWRCCARSHSARDGRGLRSSCKALAAVWLQEQEFRC